MVAAAPNRTVLVGRIEAIHPHPSLARWDVLTLLVESADRVDGFNDMIHAEPGQLLEVAIDHEWLPARQPLTGATVRLSTTVAGPDVVKAVYGRPAVSVVSPRA